MAGNKSDKLKALGTEWLEKINAAGKREKAWRDDADAAEIAYSADTDGDLSDAALEDCNILHSNIETIVPAIFNSTPVPDIRRRWPAPIPPQMPQMPQQMSPQQPQMPPQPPNGQQPPVAPQAPPVPPDAVKDVADLLERAIVVQTDDNKLDREIEGSAQDGWLAGRGIVRIRLDAEETEQEVEVEGTNENGEPVAEKQTATNVSGEVINYEVVPWADYREGPARRFEDVPWVAFRHHLSREQLAEWDDSIEATGRGDDAEIVDDTRDSDDDKGGYKVWEIWDKKTRKVIFLRVDTAKALREVDDPLKLKGFFPNPEPVQPINLTGKRTPINPYKIYRNLAEEMDNITRRINAIAAGMKVKGGFVGGAASLSALADANDNELVAIEDVEGFNAAGGLEKLVVWWPIEKAQQVLAALYVARTETRQLIYEITGIADIHRGASDPREGVGTQKLKAKFGSVRVRKMQRLIVRQVRDLFVLTAEAIAKNFTVSRLQQITGMQVTPEMMAVLNEGVSQYLINVESDSTIRADLEDARAEMSGFLEATGAYFSVMAPIIQLAPEAAEPTAALYKEFTRQFALGREAEVAVDKMVEIAKKSAGGPQDKDDGKKADQEHNMAKLRLEAKVANDKAQAEMSKNETAKMKVQSEAAFAAENLKSLQTKNAHAMQITEAELEIKQIDIQLKELDRDIAIDRLEFEKVKAEAEIEIEREQKRAAAIGDT